MKAILQMEGGTSTEKIGGVQDRPSRLYNSHPTQVAIEEADKRQGELVIDRVEHREIPDLDQRDGSTVMTGELPQRRSIPRLCTLHFADIRELRQPRSIGTGWT